MTIYYVHGAPCTNEMNLSWSGECILEPFLHVLQTLLVADLFRVCVQFISAEVCMSEGQLQQEYGQGDLLQISLVD